MSEALNRRDFVRLLGGAAAVAGITGLPIEVDAQRNTAPGPDAAERELALLALDAARSAGATYADVRIIRALYRSAASGQPVRLPPFAKRERPSLEQEIRRPPIDKPEVIHASAPSGAD